MAAALFKKFPDLVAKADAVLGYSVEALCVTDRENQLKHTEFTQPALFVANALYYHNRLEKDNRVPDFVAGHSLGEFSALYAAGAYSFETGLRIVQKRGQLMAQAAGGGMAAVLGLSSEQVENTLAAAGLTDAVFIANLNCPGQVVVSGPLSRVEESEAHFQRAGCSRFVQLNVTGAFHSPEMADAAAAFESFLGGLKEEIRAPRVPVVSNVTAAPHRGNGVTAMLVAQMTSPVRWAESIAYLHADCRVEDFEEVGPGTVLAKLVARCLGRPHKPTPKRERTAPKS